MYTSKVFVDFVKVYQSQNKPFEASPKLKLLQALDLAPSSLLERIRELRNELEHEYKLPDPNSDKESIKDGIDIADLFIGYSENVLLNFLEMYFFSDVEDVVNHEEEGEDYIRGVAISYYAQNNTFKFEAYDKCEYLGTTIIDINHESYLPLLRLHIALSKKKSTTYNQSYLALFRVLNCPTPEEHIVHNVLIRPFF